ncbi:hypothetical protein AAG906_005435 [Vitis piasezkii]
MAKTRGAQTPSPSARNIRPRASPAPSIPPSKGGVPPSPPQRPMVTQPSIEENLNCRARPFHSELCFDRETFRHQLELRDLFHLLQRYHLENLMTPRDFFYPRVALDFYQSMTTHHVWDPTVIHFTIDGRHGILGARHIVEALHILYEPHVSSGCVPALQHTSTSAYGAKERSYTRGLIQDIRGFLLWPSSFDHDLSSLLEEKVQGRSYESDAILLLFPRLLYQILEHLGYPFKPQLEREIPKEIIAPAPAVPSIVLTLEARSSAPPTTPGTPPVIPATSTPPPSESTITISA